jgi:hypothetical protein
MKKAFLLSLFVIATIASFSQFTYKIKADSTRLYNDSCNAELIIENATRNVPGFLYNRGNGRTEFRKPMIKLNDSAYLFGGDTLKLNAINYDFINGLSRINSSVKLGGTLTENTSLNIPTNNYLRFITNNTNPNYYTDGNSKIHIGANYTSHLGGSSFLQNTALLNIYEKYNVNGENPSFLAMSTPDVANPNGWLFYNYGGGGMVYPRLITRSNFSVAWSIGYHHQVSMDDKIASPASYAYRIQVLKTNDNDFVTKPYQPVTNSRLFVIDNGEITKFSVLNKGQLYVPYYLNNSTEDSVLTTDINGNVKLKAFSSFNNSPYAFGNGIINDAGTIKLGGIINQPTLIESSSNFSIFTESTDLSITPSHVSLIAANALNQTQSGIFANGASSIVYGEVNLPKYPITRNNGSGTKFLTTDSSGNVQLKTVDFSGVGSGISSLNTLIGPNQAFATGTTGTDFNISSAGTTHTFNIPDASATNRGLVTTGAQTFAGTKSFSALASGGTAPTPSGTTKMVITDANGQLSFTNLPSGGSAATVISLHSDATTNITLTNQQNSEQDLTNDSRTQRYGDLSGKTQARVICRIATASNSPNSPRLYLQYSTNGSTWQNIGQTTTPSISMSTTGIKDTGWFTITSSAAIDNVYFRVAQNGGNSNADPAIGYVEVWLK